MVAESVAEQPARSSGRATTVATVFLLAVVPLVCASFFLVASLAHDSLAYDARNAYLPAAEAVLDGTSPYVEVDDPRLAAETAYVYPPPLAYALTPLTPLPVDAAAVVLVLLGVALVAGTLLLLGVTDWRCYGATLVWAPTLIGLQTASSSLLVTFAAALVWRFRAAVWPNAAALGLAVAVKLLLWPLLVWTLATRRIATTVYAIAVAAAAVLGSWALLGFEDLGRYPDLLRRLVELEAEETYSVVGFAAALGVERTAGTILSVVVGGALCGACFAFARRGDDFRAFASAIAAALAFTPILWQHYLVLLVVPLAVARPRFSLVWLLPVVLWLAPREDNGQALQTLLPLAIAAVLVALLLVPERPGSTRAAPAGSR